MTNFIIFNRININRSFINNTGLNEDNGVNNLLDINVSHEFDTEFNIISHSK